MQNSINLTPHLYNYGIDELAYYDQGKGEQTILLIHGFGEDHTIWKNQIEFYLLIIESSHQIYQGCIASHWHCIIAKHQISACMWRCSMN